MYQKNNDIIPMLEVDGRSIKLTMTINDNNPVSRT